MRRFSFGLLLVVCFCVNCEKKNTSEPDQNDTTGTVTDIDGNVYKTVKIGGQWWMAENLRVTHYRNGTPIPNVTDNTEWINLTSGAYCNINNESNNALVYGRLYNWFAVHDSRLIASVGWHIASGSDWSTLFEYLGGYEVAGGKMKETGTTHWLSPNTGATNESGFTALPGGCRSNLYGIYSNLGYEVVYFADTTDASPFVTILGLYYNTSEIGVPYDEEGLYNGYYVRCVKD